MTLGSVSLINLLDFVTLPVAIAGTGFATTVMNEQTASPGETYTYDRAGNLISETNTSTHVTTSYTYDFRTRLTEVTVGSTVIATYGYDALNRRIGIDD